MITDVDEQCGAEASREEPHVTLRRIVVEEGLGADVAMQSSTLQHLSQILCCDVEMLVLQWSCYQLLDGQTVS